MNLRQTQNQQPILFSQSKTQKAVVVQYPMLKQKPLMTTDAFKYVGAKDGGISSGGLYKDVAGETWLLKEGQWGDIENGVKEYIAGGIFQHLLGDYAPRTELVYDEAHREILVGSKFINNFQTLSEFNGWDWSNPKYLQKSYQGKPIKNFANVLSAVLFCNDQDAHQGNVGIKKQRNEWTICKIDHGYALEKKWGDTTLSDFKNQMTSIYYGTLKGLGYNNVYNAIKMVANVNYQEIEKIVSEKVDNAKRYLKVSNQENSINLTSLKMDILSLMKNQIKSFKTIKNNLDIEEAIVNKNLPKFKALMSQGLVDLDAKFNPFKDESSWSKYTPLELAKKHKSTQIIDFVKNQAPSYRLAFAG